MTERIKKLEEELLEEINKESKVQDVRRGNVVTVSGMEWIVLKVDGENVHCVLKNLLPDMTFDSDCNNYNESSIRTYLNEDFLKKLNVDVIEHDVNLLSLDGQTEYCSVLDKISLLTVDQYRENRDILPNTGKWWWLATPWSTKCNDYEKSVCCVSSSGDFINSYCDAVNAVRPFCIFPSYIFES